ncbi:uncharacterized protein DS421_15g516680 [Arachis hypogaea]|nr:uncharacterized protein DS421_15g516680 [Arachis hypogaea]
MSCSMKQGELEKWGTEKGGKGKRVTREREAEREKKKKSELRGRNRRHCGTRSRRRRSAAILAPVAAIRASIAARTTRRRWSLNAAATTTCYHLQIRRCLSREQGNTREGNCRGAVVAAALMGSPSFCSRGCCVAGAPCRCWRRKVPFKPVSVGRSPSKKRKKVAMDTSTAAAVTIGVPELAVTAMFG